ncbi:N-acetyl-1-D-myo-inositol-2-amino-2-deoxy-alpha-D-glucopyranoside deacetylase [Streptomyces xiaopingdaonensis]|uniref:N-acetyl-1-D-myo-inositol-2-amino-2-deoxy-alpha- D-glucopyranoside deacetylase n=1 Tax=Streptomyces xiaopingdaonensis TaxID=1565415 RepID=UPI000309ED8A|nr:N-acetyl-1-D-myo-inositol-2-amino-2-deoxy-alpha-D-glucopyranoside deacetylase [Streptomyces xiaopingdaonensis]
MTEAPERRLLLVHAHPDDESINNGATMAKYAAQGAHVTLVTCTLGEEGEVVPAGLAHLAPTRKDALGPHREGELAAAMAALGVVDHRLLGGPGRYRDSGMFDTPSNVHPRAFWQAPVDEAAAELADTVREVRPQVLVTYGPDGGYGHPDHIQAHRVTMRAAELAADPGHAPEGRPAHRVARIYWNCVPHSEAHAGLDELRTAAARGDTSRFPAPPENPELPAVAEGLPEPPVAEAADLPGLVPDGAPDVRVDATTYAEAKAAAMRAHATQLTVGDGTFALSNGLVQPLRAVEHYLLADALTDVAGPSAPLSDDLFAGVDA